MSQHTLDRRQFVKTAGVAGAALATGGAAWGCVAPGPATDQTLPGPDPAERDLALHALDEAQSAGAKYADARVFRHWTESINAREDRITGVSKSDSYGIGVRALVSGSWGFAATRELTPEAVARAARDAMAIARANDRVLNRFQVGRELMTFMGNRTEPGGCATVGWDDEGVAATAWPIIEDGIFVNYQTTREQAAWIADQTGVRNSLGCAYGQYWSSMPFQRMPNVSLMPGAENLSEEDVIAATDHGILVEGRGSYSIDQQRYNFQFSGQVFWEIRNGRKFQMLRDVAYVARTPDFWNSMALIGGPGTYYLGASSGDAKGHRCSRTPCRTAVQSRCSATWTSSTRRSPQAEACSPKPERHA